MRTRFLNSKTGFTLVEVLVALFIIALVIMGGGMFFFYGRVQIVREAHRRAAILVASKRLEELKRANYLDITSGDFTLTGSPYWIVWDEGNDKWQPLETLSYDYVTVDNLVDQKMVTQAQLNDDNGNGKYDHLQATVTVEWTNGTTKMVKVDTLIAPREALP